MTDGIIGGATSEDTVHRRVLRAPVYESNRMVDEEGFLWRRLGVSPADLPARFCKALDTLLLKTSDDPLHLEVLGEYDGDEATAIVSFLEGLADMEQEARDAKPR